LHSRSEKHCREIETNFRLESRKANSYYTNNLKALRRLETLKYVNEDVHNNSEVSIEKINENKFWKCEKQSYFCSPF
jgi:hypothetical protein